MTITGTAVGGSTKRFPSPLSMTIRSDIDVPADRMTFTVPFSPALDLKLTRVHVGQEGKTLFYGTVDEQEITLSGEGSLLRVKARSLAAILLDNEARPGTYYKVTIADLYNLYVKAYGFPPIAVSGNPYLSSFTVSKGMSVWDALCTFCLRVYNCVPGLSIDGKLFINSLPEPNQFVVSNTQAGARRYLHAAIKRNRYGVLSSIYIRSAAGSYSTRIANDQAGVLDINRVRYSIPATQDALYAKTDCYRRIRQSMRDMLTIEITLAGLVCVQKGDFCTFSYEQETYRNYYVGGVRQSLNGEAPITVVTLYNPYYIL